MRSSPRLSVVHKIPLYPVCALFIFIPCVRPHRSVTVIAGGTPMSTGERTDEMAGKHHGATKHCANELGEQIRARNESPSDYDPEAGDNMRSSCTQSGHDLSSLHIHVTPDDASFQTL